jgi:hypothetical protein
MQNVAKSESNRLGKKLKILFIKLVKFKKFTEKLKAVITNLTKE